MGDFPLQAFGLWLGLGFGLGLGIGLGVGLVPPPPLRYLDFSSGLIGPNHTLTGYGRSV